MTNSKEAPQYCGASFIKKLQQKSYNFGDSIMAEEVLSGEVKFATDAVGFGVL